jgi:hypothetical protein
MNPDPAQKLRQRQSEESTAGQEQSAENTQAAQEYSTVEELLRHDAAENRVPPEVAHRLNASLAAEPRRAQSWLKRLFG